MNKPLHPLHRAAITRNGEIVGFAFDARKPCPGMKAVLDALATPRPLTAAEAKMQRQYMAPLKDAK